MICQNEGTILPYATIVLKTAFKFNLKGSITILGGKQDLTTLQVRGGRLPEVKKVAKAS